MVNDKGGNNGEFTEVVPKKFERHRLVNEGKESFQPGQIFLRNKTAGTNFNRKIRNLKIVTLDVGDQRGIFV